MAVALLGTPTSFGAGLDGFTTTPTIAHTVGSGTGVVSYICVRTEGQAITSMDTFGGVTPVLFFEIVDAGITVYRVVSPAAGATAATANLAAESPAAGIAVITLQGVDTADPDDAQVTNSAVELPVSATVTSGVTDDLVIGFGLMVAADINSADGATLATEQESLGTAARSIAIVYEAGAASVTVGITSSVSFGDNYLGAWNVNAAAGGGGGSIAAISSYYNLLRYGNG